MVAEIVETKRNEMHLVPIFIKGQKSSGAADWMVVNGYKGIIPLYGVAQSVAASGAEAITYGAATITVAGTATSTSHAVTSATITRTGEPFYILTAGGEIIEVTNDSAPTNASSTWTLRRGCLGTTATATGMANTNVVAIMNIIFLSAALVGPTLIAALPLPNDAGSQMFA